MGHGFLLAWDINPASPRADPASEGADSSVAGVPTSPPAARHGDGWGPAAIGGIEVGTGAALSLVARASCCGLKQRAAMAGLRSGVLLLTVRKKVHLTASSSSGMRGAWSGSGKEGWVDADAGCLLVVGVAGESLACYQRATTSGADFLDGVVILTPKPPSGFCSKAQKLCSGSIAPGARGVYRPGTACELQLATST
ncbi:hypothetical protein C2845_PM04G31660 [Panicum miliaceum]|uniref:Uncharacterized protein n=1 Tax=Panicum miliaceum TaxID=4540 RepID=A0A3L6QSN9_PANMI|nr:hypothetical protein C2845_PM04G31660 [Panicum miliaceum]